MTEYTNNEVVDLLARNGFEVEEEPVKDGYVTLVKSEEKPAERFTVTSEVFARDVSDLAVDIRDLKDALLDNFGDYLGFEKEDERQKQN